MAFGFLERLRSGLTRTREGLTARLQAIFLGRRVDEELFEEVEETLLAADVGVATTLKLVDELRQHARRSGTADASQLYEELKRSMASLLSGETGLAREDGLTVVMIVGVNGVGKTTTVGKLAHYLSGQGHKVILGAGDTFRAAATEQLEVWGGRTKSPVIKGQESADPAAVVFDALTAARSRGADYLLIDTAGRLHTKANLMEELKKIRRVVARELPGAPHEVLLVLDATTGQNAIQQARLFGEAADVTGLVVTKLDGTAKGGVIFAVREELGLPVKFIGVGEQAEDLRPFEAQAFVDALFS